MAQVERAAFVQHLKEMADAIATDMDQIRQMVQRGLMTDDESNEILARLSGELDTLNEMIHEFSKYL